MMLSSALRRLQKKEKNEPKGSNSPLGGATTKSASRNIVRKALESDFVGDQSQTIVMMEYLGTVTTLPSPRSWVVVLGPVDG